MSDKKPKKIKTELSLTHPTPYVKVATYEAKKGFDRCLLLYSGGLDTSVMLKWIQEEYECKIVALTVDIGQKSENLEEIRLKAITLGAEHAIVVDAKDEFADLILTEAIKANADYQGGYALSCPLGRVMISKIAVQVAKEYNCQVIAHGCTGKGNDQVRFESYVLTLDPSLKIIAPVREWCMGREEEIEYALRHNIPVKQKAESPYSYDENMWGNTGEGGEVERPELIPPLENILQWCVTSEKAPDQEEIVEIEFKQGKPIALNGEKMKLSAIIKKLNEIGSQHAIGIIHLIEDRIVGLKVRGLYENPAATILIEAHRNLEQLVSTREENELKRFIDTKWAYLTYAAKWYDPVMYHIHAFTESQNKKVQGCVKVRLYKGSATCVALTSVNSLFDHTLATFNRSTAFNQNASAGFVEIYSLPQKTAYNVHNFEADLGKN